jgi:hypothetical protein
VVVVLGRVDLVGDLAVEGEGTFAGLILGNRMGRFFGLGATRR